MIGLIITGLVITLGGGPDRKRIGFEYWKNPGAVARAGLVNDVGSDRFVAILSVVVQAAFSFQSMEIVAMYALGRVSPEKNTRLTASVSAASETESPRRNIAKAVKRVFWRILIFYVCSRANCVIERPHQADNSVARSSVP